MSSVVTSATREALFKPFAYGRSTLRNRIVMAPMTRSHSPGGVPGPNVVEYYRRRAEGGVGLIVSEGTTIQHKAANGYPQVPRFWGDDALEGWQKVIEAVHREGGHMAPQIWHVGPARRPGIEPDPTVPGYGPSEVVEEGVQVVREMSRDDIAEAVAGYGQAAANAQRIGFDGVEIHGAHGYLIDAFLWDGANRRTDEYGGSIENRTRFALEVVKAVRASVTPDFPVALRFSQFKISSFTAKIANDEAELARILLPLSSAGVDIFHASTRSFWVPAFDGSTESLAAVTKRITGKPVVAVGGFGMAEEYRSGAKVEESGVANVERAIDGLEEGDFDLIAAGRVLLAEPDWVNKIRDHRDDEIRTYTEAARATLVV